ncbi:MAG: hypothetical protein L7W94_10820 [Alphaproteobacteria bacterium]|nr:hypothetical protein [Alphaproteobacteria bacterium]
MLALPGASVVLAAQGDEPASPGFWAAVDSVGKLYAIKGRQLADDVKTNYLQLAGGDPDDLEVPSAIIEDGFMDGGGDQPAAEPAPETPSQPAPETSPEQEQQAAPAIQDDAPAPVDTAPVDSAPVDTAPEETASAAETAESQLPMTLPISSPVRVPLTETANGAGALTLEGTEIPVEPALTLDGSASVAQELTLDAITAPEESAPTAPAPVPIELAEDAGETTAEVAETETAKACFELMTVSLTDSTLIDPVMSDAMFAGDIGACITPDLIGGALERLNGYFLDAGFVTTRAYITPQDLSTGTLGFTVVEGTIEDIRLNDGRPEDKRRVRMAFAAKPGDILNINEIDQGLAQLNRPQSVKATLNLVPGTEAGQTVVQIDEAIVRRPVRYKAGLDNSGSRSTGTTKSTLGVDADNLLSLNETVSLSHIGSADTNALAGSFTMPVGRYTVEASSSYSDYLSDVDALTQIFGRTDSRELKVTRALFKTETGDVKAEFSLAKKSTRRTINDLVLTPQRLTTTRAGLKYSGRLDNGISLSSNLYLAAGTKLLNATRDNGLDKTAPRAQFRKIEADGSVTFTQFPGMTVQTTYAGQLAPHPLYSSEQISAGGQKSVRGFKGNAISGDSGFYAQTDVILPVAERFMPKGLESYAASLQVYGGLDFGAARDLASGSTNVVAGGRGGMRMNFGGLSGEIGAGAPLYRKRGIKNNRVETYVKFLYSIAEL